jgi:hypothetical protein
MAGSIKRDPNTVLANTSRDILGSFEATTTLGIYLVVLKRINMGYTWFY